jgi:GST-like protein
MASEFVLYGQKGAGSVAVEAALTLIGAPFRVVDVEPRARLGEDWNPVGQVPALVLPGGELMTESAAILIWLADAHPAARLSPPVDDVRRPAFLRWMSFVSAAIYSLYWLRDDPSRGVADPAAQAELKSRIHDRLDACWAVMEAGIAPPDPWLLGADISVLDLYVAVVSRWTPRAKLHEQIAPRVGQVARRVESHPKLVELMARRFPLKAA